MASFEQKRERWYVSTPYHAAYRCVSVILRWMGGVAYSEPCDGGGRIVRIQIVKMAPRAMDDLVY